MFGFPERPLRWPTALPVSKLNYTLNIEHPSCDASDPIASASVEIKPSGAGELQALGVSVDGSAITVQLTGGVPGRDYLIQVIVTWLSGADKGFLANLAIDPRLSTWPPPAPPSTDFGTQITWSAAALNFSNRISASYLAL